MLGQLVLDPIRIGALLVDLVDRDDHRHAGGLRVLDGLDGLGHDAVIGGHHQHHHVGGLGTARTHGGERRVARGIEEGHAAVIVLDVVGADVLGDAAGLAGGDLGTTDVVEQRGLAVVDVTHDGHDRRTGDLVAFIGDVLEDLGLQRIILDQLGLVAHFLDHDGRGVLIDGLVDGHRRAHGEHGLDDLVRLDGHLVGQVGDADRLGDGDLTDDRLRRLLEAVLAAALAATAAAAATLGALGLLAAATTLLAVATVVFALMTPLLAGLLAGRSGTAVGATFLRRCRRLLGLRRGVQLGHRNLRLGLGGRIGLGLGLLGLSLLLGFTRGLLGGTFGFLGLALGLGLRHVTDQLTRTVVLGLRLLGGLLFLALDVGALLADLHLDALAAVAALDATARLAGQGNTVLGRGLLGAPAVTLGEVVQQLALVLFGHGVALGLVLEPGFLHLFQQAGHFTPHLHCKILNGHF